MRLFLSSQDFGNYPEILLEMVGHNKKVAFIANAQDDKPDYRDATLQNKLSEFTATGLEPENIDLRDYFGKSEQLKDKLAGYGLVWARGGNTFVLRRAMKDSGLDRILIDLLKKDELAYGGSSAGSIVATPSLRGTEFGDNPSAVQSTYNKDVIWDGLNLVPFCFVPHYKSEWFGKESDGMVNYLKNNKVHYHALMDGQVIAVIGDKMELLK